MAARPIRSVPDYTTVVMEEYRFLRGENEALLNQLHTFALTGASTFFAEIVAASLSLAFGSHNQNQNIAYCLAFVVGGVTACWYLAICSSLFLRYMRNANDVRIVIEEKVRIAFRSAYWTWPALAPPGSRSRLWSGSSDC